jgi:hypothetical protein
MTGLEVKQVLGLTEIKNIYVQRILQTGVPTFVFTFDSRYSKSPLNVTRVLKVKTQQIFFVKKSRDSISTKYVRMSIPQRLEQMQDFQLFSNAIYVMRDLAGEYMRNRHLFEHCKKLKLNIIWSKEEEK